MRSDQKLVFPALGWQQGEVADVRPGWNPDFGDFKVIKVAFDDGETREFAASLNDHVLNNPPDPSKNEFPTPQADSSQIRVTS